MDDATEVLHVDLSGVTFLDSTGLGALTHSNEIDKASGKQLVLVAPSERLQRLLQITGMDRVFDIEAAA